MRGEALFLRVGLGSTPVRLFTPLKRAGIVELHVRAMGAYASSGKSMAMFPELMIPSIKSSSGILSTLPMAELFIDDLVASGPFKCL